MKSGKPRLSICICTMHGQAYNRLPQLTALLGVLATQPRAEEVEILIASDTGRLHTGDKRNRLNAIAYGEYLVCIDDDDLVSPNYIPKILDAIDANPGVDVILVRGRRTGGGAAVEFDYDLAFSMEAKWIDGVLWRSPAHLCPVRIDIVKQVPFALLNTGEDIVWGARVLPYLKTAARAGKPGEVLYHYRWDPDKQTPPEKP